ncbi:MAG: hypothetical protein ACP5PX_03645 [Candidatus Hadarchaeum sp.]|uniref:hypothetical protein n=1 Tax=Candidatus Hadarchaeum sp. TaxID=2883567 RepID=UPI003D097C34
MGLTWPPQRLKRRNMLAIPLIVSVVLLAVSLIFGLPLGRDLQGGTLIMVRGVEKAPDVDQVRSQIEKLTGLEAIVHVTSNGLDIEINKLSGEVGNEITVMLSSTFGFSSDSITVGELGPVVSSAQCFQLIYLGLGALAVIQIVLFIFRLRVAATTTIIVAVLDVVGTLGLMSLFKVPLNLASIFGILVTIVYVVDVNVLLAFRLLKGAVGNPKENLGEAMKAVLVLSAIAIVVCLSASFIIPVNAVWEFALALTFGIAVNLLNTWFLGAALYLRHLEHKKVVSYHVSI